MTSTQANDDEFTPLAKELCGDCGEELDYVGTPDGASGYMHCWGCWYKENTTKA